MDIDSSYYFVKRSSIVEKIAFNSRTFYAKFERIDEPLNDTLISQHLERQYTIAIPLLRGGYTEHLLIEFRGVEYGRFYHTSRHLLRSLQIENYRYYQGKKSNYLQLLITVEPMHLERADELVSQISDALATKLTKEWKCFPDKLLPQHYNIMTLPYGYFEI